MSSEQQASSSQGATGSLLATRGSLPAADGEEPIRPLPRHVAIIMDGNGRWAQERGLSRQAGHRAGTENIRRIIERFAEHGIDYLTLYAFSTENWRRSKREVDGLLRILGRVINREISHLHEHGIRLRHIGRLDALPPRLQRQVADAIELTRANTRMTVSVAFNYGGRAEIVDALRRIVGDGVPPEQIDERLVARHLYTAEIPDPDLIIRTGGEMRLSNFLLWQAAYSEFYATPTYWPDFGREEIDRALRSFAARERRFGATPR
jgi:undecaprenyl diphosphate synthase